MRQYSWRSIAPVGIAPCRAAPRKSAARIWSRNAFKSPNQMPQRGEDRVAVLSEFKSPCASTRAVRSDSPSALSLAAQRGADKSNIRDATGKLRPIEQEREGESSDDRDADHEIRVPASHCNDCGSRARYAGHAERRCRWREHAGEQEGEYRIDQSKRDDDKREALLHRQDEIERLDDSCSRDKAHDRNRPDALKRVRRGELWPDPGEHDRKGNEGIHFHEFGKLAPQHPHERLLDKIETRTGDDACDKAAEMRLPVDTRSAYGDHDIQSDIDHKKVPRQADLPENPQAKQGAQHGRYRARCADCKVWTGMRDTADDPAEDQAAEINHGEIERPDAPFQKAAPEHEAKHVCKEMNRIGMQKAITDKPPIFVTVKRLRIQGAITQQYIQRDLCRAGLRHAECENNDIGANQQLRYATGEFKEASCTAGHCFPCR